MVVKPSSKDAKVQAVLIPKKANNGFTMSHMDEQSFPNELKILHTIPSFSLPPFSLQGFELLC